MDNQRFLRQRRNVLRWAASRYIKNTPAYAARKGAEALFGANKPLYSKRSTPSSAQPIRGRRGTRIRRKPRGKIKRIQYDIRALKQHDDASLGSLTYRKLDNSSVLNIIGKQKAATFNIYTVDEVEAVLDQCQFFNPATPGTLTTASTAVGTYQRNCLISYVKSDIMLRNNYISDVEVTVYWCTVKQDTDKSPLVMWTAGVPDGSNLTDTTDIGQYPSDYNVFNDTWRTKRVFNGVLAPGKSVSCSNNIKSFEYDSAQVDTHNLKYQAKCGSSAYLVVVKGTQMHDVALPEYPLGPGGVDVSSTISTKITYNAGINISRIYVVNNMPTAVTNQEVQSHQPTADNQAYSVS